MPPLYVYECQVCRKRQEHVRSIGRRDYPVICQHGLAQHMCRRVITPVAGIVKNPAVPRGKP